MQDQIIEAYPLSPQQERLWSLLGSAHNCAYSAACTVLIRGHLQRELLRAALEDVVNRHAILRTSFRFLPAMSVVSQVVDARAQFLLDQSIVSAETPATVQAQLDNLFAEACRREFKLDGEPQLRASVIRLRSDEHALIISLPAMCADMQGLTNLIRKIARCLDARMKGKELADEIIQYADLAEWQNELLESEETAVGRQFWKQRDYASVVSQRLQCEKEPSNPTEYRLSLLRRKLPNQLSDKCAEVAKQHKRNEANLLQACWHTLLWMHTGRSPVGLFRAYDGRKYDALREEIGLMARHLPVEVVVEAGSRFSRVLLQVDEAIEEAYKWQEYFGWEQQDARGGRDAGFGFEYYKMDDEMKAGGVTLRIVRQYACNERMKIKLRCVREQDGLAAEWEYDADLYDEEVIRGISGGYEEMLQSVLEDLESFAGELEAIGKPEREQIASVSRGEEANYAGADCLHELLEEQARRTPEQVAVVAGEEMLTYEQLNARANKVARYLTNSGVRIESRVGVFVHRSIEMVVGLLGILKAGGAYVPLDRGYPSERLRVMVEDANVEVLLTAGGLERVEGYEGEVVSLDAQWKEIARQSKDEFNSGVRPENLAYVIYTSGSTGKPKGVMIEHRSICNRLKWMQAELPLTSADRLLQKTPTSFDASVWELFVPLMSGARLIMAEPGGHRDATYLVQAIERQEVTVLQVVPTMLEVLLKEGNLRRSKTLRRVYCGGEVLPRGLQERFLQEMDVELHNLYGPTEVSIDATHWECERGGDQASVPIGWPIGNMQVYVLSERMRMKPAGVEGELYVGGIGLARGYEGCAAATGERFVPNPYGEAGRRLYSTGDVGRRRADHALEYIGRIDHQVKVRGHRIELGEIEAALHGHPAVRQAAVVAREDDTGRSNLVAYVAPDKNKVVSASHGEMYRLPNGLQIFHFKKSETDLLYKEIVEDCSYIRHGITLADGDCIFDVGANLGLFTLFIHQYCRNARVFAFEPIPSLFELLRANKELYAINATLYEVALSDSQKEAQFIFYPNASTMSGLYADARADAEVTRTFLRNQQREFGELDDEFLRARFEGQPLTCRLTTISDIIKENCIERIDLLKIDVEKSELDVLRGIKQSDWGRIKQIVVEVHDIDGRLAVIRGMLEAHDYKVTVDQDPLLQGTGLYNIYASSESAEETALSRTQLPALEPSLPTMRQAIFSVGELRTFIRNKLPEPMVPSAFVVLDQLPLAPNGKIDRRALPPPESIRSEEPETIVTSRTPVEKVLRAIWAQTLGLKDVGSRDDFFNIGGHSLLATQMLSRVRDAFGIDVKLRTLFDRSTIEQLGKEIDRIMSSENGPQTPLIKPLVRDGELPLSFAQQRLWFIDQLEPHSPLYNVPTVARITGRLDANAMVGGFGEIMRRHDSLRTVFAQVGGRPVQVVKPAAGVKLRIIDLTGLSADVRKDRAMAIARQEARAGFDLGQGPLVRVALVRLSEMEHIALLTMHHIVSDGWSVGIMVRELGALYEASVAGKPSPLQELEVQYSDFAQWQRHWLEGGVLGKQAEYWSKQLDGAPERLALPTDRPRAETCSYAGSQERFQLSKDLTEGLKKLSNREGATLFMVLLAAFQTLLCRYSNQNDIVVGTDIAGRHWTEIEGLIGFFGNQLVLRTNLAGNPRFIELLKRVKDVTIEAYANQDMPFAKLVEVLNPDRRVGHTPLFQVKMVLQNAPTESLTFPYLTLELLEDNNRIGLSRFDLLVTFVERDQALSAVIEYSSDLFERATIIRMQSNLEKLLESIVAQPEANLNSLEIFTEDEIRERDMQKKERQESSFMKFRSTKPKVLSLSPTELVKISPLWSESTPSLMIEPDMEGVNLVEWLAINRAFVEKELLDCGAILFRGFNLSSQAQFEQFLGSTACQMMTYTEGATPRTRLSEKVYTSTEYPANQYIALHNELTYVTTWPMKIYFFCLQPALEGGETPIADVRRVFNGIDPRIVDRFAEKGWMLMRNFGQGLSLPWQTSFHTSDRTEAELYFRRACIEWEWKGDGLRTRQVRPAVAKHPRTSEMVWFNHVAFWHVSSLEPKVRESMLAVFKEEDLPYNTYYGDGSPIEGSVVEEIREAYRQERRQFVWQAGDILMLENMLVAHGRNPYSGPRKVLVAMGEASNITA
jgi:amino acid adenylation domain-containing protein/FkbM family methyltransferase